MKKVEAFAILGAELKNDRWSWCGISSGTPNVPEGTKVFTAWSVPGEFFRDHETRLYHYHPVSQHWDWNKPGGAEMHGLLDEAFRTQEFVRVIVVEPVDSKAEVWQVEYAKPDPGLWRVTKWDPVSREFHLDMVSRPLEISQRDIVRRSPRLD